jgi:hypothetical protein
VIDLSQAAARELGEMASGIAPHDVSEAALKELVRRAEAAEKGVTICTIPVPVGWTVEQTWDAIRHGDIVTHPDGDPTWVNIETVDDKLVRVRTDPREPGRTAT